MTGSKLVLTGFGDNFSALSFATIVSSGSFNFTILEESLVAVETGSIMGDYTYMIVLLVMAAIFVVSIVYSVIKFGIFGIGTFLSLCVYAGVTLFMLVFLPVIIKISAPFTLAAAIGLLIGLCITCGFSILMQASVTAEYRSGKTFKRAVEEGVRRVTMTIVDISAVTLLFSLVLWIVLPAALTGLAMALLVNSITSALSLLFVTRMFISLLGTACENKLRLFKLDEKTSIREGRAR